MRYRLGLAQALLGSPELLLLDEPTTGLDPAHVREVREAIANCAARGVTVVLSSHLLSEVEQICSHVAIMQRGQLIAYGAVADVLGRRADDAGSGHSHSLEEAYLSLVDQAAGARRSEVRERAT
jgi:ABC-type multidrug transport system ATPase subunit